MTRSGAAREVDELADQPVLEREPKVPANADGYPRLLDFAQQRAGSAVLGESNEPVATARTDGTDR